MPNQLPPQRQAEGNLALLAVRISEGGGRVCRWPVRGYPFACLQYLLYARNAMLKLLLGRYKIPMQLLVCAQVLLV